MKNKYEELERSIKKIHRFAFFGTPKYEEVLTVPIKKFLFLPIAEKVVQLLGWEYLGGAEDTIYAETKNKWGVRGRVTICYEEYTKISIRSESLMDQIWDNGRNSRRVKLFIRVLLDEIEHLSDVDRSEIEQKFEKEYNWDDYEVPKIISPPLTLKAPNFWVPLIATLFASIISAFIYVEIVMITKISILVPDLVVVFFMYLVVTRVARFANYTEIKGLITVLVTGGITITGTVFIRMYMLSAGSTVANNFLDWLINRYSSIAELNILELLYFLFSILFYYSVLSFVFYLRIIKYRAEIIFDRIPEDVYEYALYLVSKGHSLESLRLRLSEIGWEKEKDQDFVIEALMEYGASLEMLKTI